MTSSGGSTETNFSELAAKLLQKSQDVCGGDADSLSLMVPSSISSTSLRSWLFSNLKSDSGHQRMVDVLTRLGGAPVKSDLSHAYQDYIRTKWFSVCVCVLALVVFVIGLILCCAVSSRFRRFWRKLCCCGKPKSSITSVSGEDSSLVSGSEIIQHGSAKSPAKPQGHWALLVVGIISFLIVMLAVGFGIQSIIALNESERVISCNMWLEISGYFNGARTLMPPRINSTNVDDYATLANLNINERATGEQLASRVSVDWPGSMSIREQLSDLVYKSELTTDNPIYQTFKEGRHTLETEVESLRSAVDRKLSAVDDYIDKYDSALSALATDLTAIAKPGAWTGGYSFVFSLKKVYLSKQQVFSTEVASALKASWPILDQLIEKYAGVKSTLLQKANDAATSAMSSIDAINLSIKAMYDIWRPLSVNMRAGVIVIIVLGCAAGASAIVATALVIHLISHQIRKYKQNRRVARETSTLVFQTQASLDAEIKTERRHRSRCWLWASIFCGLALALSALLSGITFLLSALGADACQAVDQSLLTNGMWDMLGESILHPTSSSPNLSMPSVLDTCVKRGAVGSIAATLGLDAATSEISDALENAIDEINQTRKTLLLRNSRHMRVEIIGFLIKELLRGFSHQSHWKTDGIFYSPRVQIFNELQELNFENHTTITEGRRVLLAPIPYWPTLTSSVSNHGLFYTLGTIPDAYNMLNTISDLAFAANSQSKVPRFCGATARKRKLACSYYTKTDNDPRDIVDLADYTTNSQSVIDSWLDTLNTDVPTYKSYNGNIKTRLRQLIGATVYVEAAANHDAESLGLMGGDSTDVGVPKCVNELGDEVACTFDDARQFHQQELDEIWTSLSLHYEAMIGKVDEYVDDIVIPTSRALIKEADEVVGDSNCQFQGTQLENMVYAPLCWTFFPILMVISILSCILFCVMVVLEVILWSFESTFNHYRGADMVRTDVLQYPAQEARTSEVIITSPEYTKIHTNTLTVPRQPKSLSSASYADSVRQYGSETFAPIFSPIRVHHYN